MSSAAIHVDKLGKRYRLGQTAGYKTLRDTLGSILTAPVKHGRNRSRQPESPSVSTGGSKDHLWALRDVSFDIQQGETVGIIGRNGSGKSTLLKILSRITVPTEGMVEIRGRAGAIIEVGTGFNLELSGRENIYLNGAILGLKKAEIDQRFPDIVSFAEIEKFLDTPVKRYSSGMYVRLAFSVAAHLEPDILLVDEVLAVGDSAFQRKCMGKMRGVAQEGRTVLFVSHNMTSIEELCSRAIWLKEGHVEGDGPAPQIISDYFTSESKFSSGDLDVSDLTLRRNQLAGSRFRWTRIAVIGSSGKSTTMLASGEPFEIILEGRADSEIAEARLGFAVNSAFGITVFNSFQTDCGLPEKLPAGKVGFRVRIDPNLLAPGIYDISLTASGSGVSDWLTTTLQFTISAAGDNSSGWRSYHSGMIQQRCAWKSER